MVDGGFRLDLLLTTAQLARTTCYYQLDKEDKDKNLKTQIQAIYHERRDNYSYRRIHWELHNRGFCVNHKKVQHLMKEMGVAARIRRKRKYSSADNLIK